MVDCLPIHQFSAFGKAACVNILRDGQLVNQIQLLKDDADAVGGRHQRIGDIDFFAIDEDLTLIFFIVAVQNLHQRGFSRAVFSDQSADLTFGNGESHIVQSFDAGKRFADMAYLKKSCVHRNVSFFSEAG